MSLKNFITIGCEKALYCCDQKEYKEAGFLARWKFKLHLIFCKACRKYAKKNAQLSTLLLRAALQRPTKAEKEDLRKRITLALSKKLPNQQ